MNLLSHYYLDHANPSAYFKTGLLLPDLVHGFNRKLRKAVFTTFSEQEEHFSLVEGIQKHYAVDAVFHQSEVFAFYCNIVKEALRPQEFPAFQHRKYFAAHIFVEMLLDRILMKQAPQLCVKLQNDLEKTDAGVLKSFFLHIEKPVIYKEFFDNFKRLLIGKPLHYYTDNEMFVKALVRVYNKINPVPVSNTETENLARLAETIENRHRKSLLEIFETVDEKLTACA